jgi:hypothetical protein
VDPSKAAVIGDGRLAPSQGVANTTVGAPVPSLDAPRGMGAELRAVSGLFAQLLVLLLVIREFNIENEAFFRLAGLTVAAFPVHHFLPHRYRLSFFVAVSLAGIAIILGPVQGLWLIGLGLGIIGICLLPVSLLARSAILLALGAGLSLPRWGLGSVPWSPAIWPVLGSMFMFRVIIYLYDRSHERQPPTLPQTLAYFFLLPNVCFPLFPVVDFKKFCRNYYDTEPGKIYQVGVEWIWRGVVQLLLYRVVYYYLTMDSVAVDNLADLVVYMVSTFLLYVRISGQFHIIVGILHLFGFNLPETHHRYFLASSFTDFWRRINIYWKDFMLKVFYYPAFFRLRKLGDVRALVLATILTFLCTWVLHTFQWFWIRGSVFIEGNDILFWSAFGLLVIVNSVYETKHGRSRTLSKTSRTLRESISVVIRTVGTFTVICILWSLWTSESITDWLLMCRSAFTLPPWAPWRFVAVAGGCAVAAVLVVYGVWRGGTKPKGTEARVPPGVIMATGLALCILVTPVVTAKLGPPGEILASLRSASLNRRDAEQFQRGYYENLLDVGKFNDELWRIYGRFPTDFVRSLSKLGLSRPTGDGEGYELVPLKEGRFVGAMVRTNRWGMRDRDYSRTRPADTYRIAMLGPSTTMGSGVEADQSFEALLEQELTANAAKGMRYEVLNFGIAGYTPLNIRYQLQKKVFSFEPNAVLYVGHAGDMTSAKAQFITLVTKQTLPADPFLQDLVRRTGIRPTTGSNEANRRMKPYTAELLDWVYRSIVADCHQRHVQPVFAYLELITESAEPWRAKDRAQVLDLAARAGFLVLDLRGVYGDRPPSSLWIAENDGHPNALASRLIADRLYALIRSKRAELGLNLQ